MRIITHKYVEFGPMDMVAAANVLKEAYPRLPMIKWLSAGTALGLYRDGDFIKNDTDLDIAIIGYPGVDIDLKTLYADYELIRSGYHADNPMQYAFLKDGIIWDVFIHWKGRQHYYNWSEFGVTKMPHYIYENASALDTKYGRYAFPQPVEEYLEIRYGTDWRTPKNEKPRFI